MAKGSYIGGGTQISVNKNPEWFGDGKVETEEFKLAMERHERAKARLAKILATGRTSNSEKYFRRMVAHAEAEVERTRPKPKVATATAVISTADEQKIAELKRDIMAFAVQAKRAAEQHEEARQKLIKLLGKYDIAPMTYPETRKLTL